MSDDFEIDHTHRDPWPAEWLACQKAMEFAGAEADYIMSFIEARGMEGFTANMYCAIVHGGDESRIMAVRRRFYDLKQSGRARMHPEGKTINNAAGNPVTAWVPGCDPSAGLSKYKSAMAQLSVLRAENVQLKQQLSRLTGQLGLPL